MGYRFAYLDLTTPMVKVKVMKMSTAVISKVVTDVANITIHIIYEFAYELSISKFLNFDLGPCKRS